MKLFGKEFTFNGFDVFHKGNKPTKTDVGLGNVDNVKQYSASNKPTPADIGAEPAFAKNNAFNKNFGTAARAMTLGSAMPGRPKRIPTMTVIIQRQRSMRKLQEHQVIR